MSEENLETLQKFLLDKHIRNLKRLREDWAKYKCCECVLEKGKDYVGCDHVRKVECKIFNKDIERMWNLSVVLVLGNGKNIGMTDVQLNNLFQSMKLKPTKNRGEG